MLRRLIVFPFVLLAAIGFTGMHRTFPWPYPPFDQLITHRNGLQDVALITAGFRCLAADLAWIELLQYVGGGFLPGEDTTRAYDELKPMALRVARIDPFFRRAYIYSGSMLAFFHNINRPREALDVLFEGIKNNPTYWPFRTTAAAIGFMQKDQFDRMAQQLEDSIQHPDCPGLVKSILANGYKAHGRPADAVRIWRNVLQSPNDAPYHAKAEQEIRLLEKNPL